MNEIEWKILFSLMIAGAFLVYLLSAKSSSHSKRFFIWNFLSWIWNFLFPSPPREGSFKHKDKAKSSSQSSNQSSGKSLQKSLENSNLNTNKNLKTKNSNVQSIEIFDYNGVKIMQDSGLWTINDGGVIRLFKDWSEIPPKYQKMVKELDKRSIQNSSEGGYFLEMINGFYFVTIPGGKKKKFKSFSDIPAEIQKLVARPEFEARKDKL